jgi:hypothetical protein
MGHQLSAWFGGFKFFPIRVLIGSSLVDNLVTENRPEWSSTYISASSSASVHHPLDAGYDSVLDERQ